MSTTGILITIGATIVGYVLLMDAFYQLARRLSRETFTAAPPPARRSCSCGWQARPGAEWCARCGRFLDNPPGVDCFNRFNPRPELEKSVPINAETLNRIVAGIQGSKP